MRFLVFGKSGQVATELQRRGAARGIAIEALGRPEIDLAHPETFIERIAATDADAVINAAAYTAVDRAESEEELAWAINAEAPAAMARAARERELPFLHVSTDYVFDGSGHAPWQPGNQTGPINAYGRTKLGGEIAIAQEGGKHVILRTSWVFSAHGGNFLKTMLRLSETRTGLSVVADQIGGPTPAADIADALLALAQAAVTGGPGFRGGIHHFSGAPDTSWADFAREIFLQAGRDIPVADIPTTDWPTPAARPLNSRLDCSSLVAGYGISRPDWMSGVAAVLAELQSRNDG
ncbi:dTDP-4-dehydrorhamnose reductase [Tropicimonas sp.]|uniref:dTDP-4-dehydrorhamnose reductase n=1 Tax=Tropicimonas sp. TaxID=2067044 RepID=UPI003A8A722F